GRCRRVAAAELHQALPARVRIHDRSWRAPARRRHAGGRRGAGPSGTVTVTVDGVAVRAKEGERRSRVTDTQGIYVPRFCYRDKLPVAANCRMCLVEVEKAPKPLPACATPVMDGMVVHTRSPKAIAAQKAVMEFLLINHPLDCPICDQGGE